MVNTQVKIPAAPATQPAIPERDEWLVELANLAQENTELHELIAAQRETIDQLQRQLRRERMSAMQAAGAVSLLRAVLCHPQGVVCQPAQPVMVRPCGGAA